VARKFVRVTSEAELEDALVHASDRNERVWILGGGSNVVVRDEGLVKLAREAGHKDITYVSRREDLAKWIDQHAKPTDLVITLGAGNIQLVCNDLIELLEKRLGPATKKNLVRVAESSATVAR
jgi:UDP-N-acetylmuramate-alanine ligase